MAAFKTIAQSLLLPIHQKFTLPQSLIYFVTSRCNASCDFCLYYDQLNNTAKDHIELTVEEVNKVASAYGKLHYLGLSGGEPFIRKDLAGICQAFINHCDVRVIDIPSNFFYGDKMVQFVHSFFKENPNVTLDLQFSLDNLGEKHDESRKVKGLFQKAIDNFICLYELKKTYPNLMLKVNLVYLPSNKHDLKNIINEIRKIIRFDRIQVTYPHSLLSEPIDDKENLINDLQNFFQIAAAADQLGSDADKNDIYSLGLRSVKKIYRKLLFQAVDGTLNTGKYCEAGKHIAVMNEVGDIFPCEILWNEKIGNVRDNNYSIKQVLATTPYEQFRKKYLGKGKCNCTWSCAMNTEVSVNYSYFPELAATALSLALNRKK
jgi:MoaA/NifB/PqqE/SkfB family radical SAM enzyme